LRFPDCATLEQIFNKAKESDLELCPAQVGPELRLAYKDQPTDEWQKIAMESILGRVGGPQVFFVYRYGSESCLSTDYAERPDGLDGEDRFVFRSRK